MTLGRVFLIALGATALQGAFTPPADATRFGITCDAFLIGADGTVAATPVRSDQVGFSSVATATAPSVVRPGERFTVIVPAEDLGPLASEAGGFPVISQSDFSRVLQVTGGAVVGGTVSQTPSTEATSATTGTTVTLGLTTHALPSDHLTFPEARFDVRAARDATSVKVVFVKHDSSLELRNQDGTTIPLRATCTPDANVLSTTLVQGPPLAGSGAAVGRAFRLGVLLTAVGTIAVVAGRRRSDEAVAQGLRRRDGSAPRARA